METRAGSDPRQGIPAKTSPGGRKASFDFAAPAFAAGITGILCILWIFSADRDGSWRQTPYWDMAWFHCQALTILERIRAFDIAGLYNAWAHGSSSHAPLVPTLSALAMALFGTSRAVAEWVLPLSSFVLVLSTFRIAERLYDRRTAYASAALVATFPVVLTYGRYYFFEGPLTACFAATCWAALASDGFTKWKPTIAFGILAGLTALTRAAGFVFLTGLVAATWWLEFRRTQRGLRFTRFALASSLGIALAGTWYFPNFSETVGYLWRVTYGHDARLYSGGSSGSFANFLYYVEWLLLDGPGVPMAALAAIGFAAAAARNRGTMSSVSRPMVWILAIVGIDFVLCVAGAQRMWGKFLLPLMPLVAIVIVRGVVNIPWRGLRVAASSAVVLLGLHHWIACTFLFDTEFQKPGVRFQASEPGMYLGELSNHHNFFLEWAKMSGGADAGIDYRIPAAADRLDALELRPGSMVTLLGSHVFISAAALQLESQRRERPLLLLTAPPIGSRDFSPWTGECVKLLGMSSAVIVRTDSPEDLTFKGYEELFASVNTGESLRFDRVGEPLTMGDGSRLWFYRTPPDRDPARSRPAGSR